MFVLLLFKSVVGVAFAPMLHKVDYVIFMWPEAVPSLTKFYIMSLYASRRLGIFYFWEQYRQKLPTLGRLQKT